MENMKVVGGFFSVQYRSVEPTVLQTGTGPQPEGWGPLLKRTRVPLFGSNQVSFQTC